MIMAGQRLWCVVGGDDDSGLFGSLCDDLEEQLGGDFCQGNIAEFINDDQLHAGPAGQHAAQAVFALRFDELVDQGQRRS